MKTIIQQGDIYKLGEHIVACGDSLDAGFVDKVIGDKKVRAIIADPPYGVAYVEGKRDFNKLGVDVDKVLEIGLMVERIIGRRLRSESIKNGRIPKTMTNRK